MKKNWDEEPGLPVAAGAGRLEKDAHEGCHACIARRGDARARKAWSRVQALAALAGWRADLVDRDGATILVASRWGGRTRAFVELAEADAWLRQVAPHLVTEAGGEL